MQAELIVHKEFETGFALPPAARSTMPAISIPKSRRLPGPPKARRSPRELALAESRQPIPTPDDERL
ncbi:MAG: hypothetical protein ACPIOQ_76665, partial [Promethearchaeia archaeon]